MAVFPILREICSENLKIHDCFVLGPVTVTERLGDLVEDRVEDVLDITLIEILILLSDPT